ncbi:MAG: PEGA domain-containing protein, partial [Methylococcales bacterium]|nr:PEGA domain-containing protein [Methylococcales bacterium]
MNQFNQQLLAAKKKQRLLYMGGFAFFLVGVFIILTIILVSRGTRIEIQPSDAAELSSVHLHKGIAVIIGETLYSISKRPAITASAEGFQSITQVLNNNDFGKVMSITLLPLPAKVELSTNITGDKTSWLIDGEVLAISNTFEHELAAGDYELTVTHPHYNDASMSLSLIRNEVFKKVIQVTPIDGMLTIKTRPKGAHVLLDDIDMGLSPLNLSLQGGFHNVSVMLDNYETINDTIEISRTKPDVNRDYRLELRKAGVNVSLTPSDGKLLLDGITVNNSNNIPVTADIKHSLSYSKQGYFTE